MYTIKCQYCGEEFGTKSKSTKNCPACKTMLALANRRGGYAEIQEVREEIANDQGLSPAERRELLEEARQNGKAATVARRQEWRDRQDQQRKNRIARQNGRQRHYQEHGHFPNDDYVDEEARDRAEQCAEIPVILDGMDEMDQEQ
jgi:hypothetical protein